MEALNMQWEYRVVEVSEDAIEDHLNLLGSFCWECFAINLNGVTAKCYLKRIKHDDYKTDVERLRTKNAKILSSMIDLQGRLKVEIDKFKKKHKGDGDN